MPLLNSTATVQQPVVHLISRRWAPARPRPGPRPSIPSFGSALRGPIVATSAFFPEPIIYRVRETVPKPHSTSSQSEPGSALDGATVPLARATCFSFGSRSRTRAHTHIQHRLQFTLLQALSTISVRPRFCSHETRFDLPIRAPLATGLAYLPRSHIAPSLLHHPLRKEALGFDSAFHRSLSIKILIKRQPAAPPTHASCRLVVVLLAPPSFPSLVFGQQHIPLLKARHIPFLRTT